MRKKGAVPFFLGDLLFISLFFIFLLSELPCPAAGTPGEYLVTIKSVELKNTASKWVTVIRPDKQADLANQEARITFFNNSGRVPPGRYINFKILLSNTAWTERGELGLTASPDFVSPLEVKKGSFISVRFGVSFENSPKPQIRDASVVVDEVSVSLDKEALTWF